MAAITSPVMVLKPKSAVVRVLLTVSSVTLTSSTMNSERITSSVRRPARASRPSGSTGATEIDGSRAAGEAAGVLAAASTGFASGCAAASSTGSLLMESDCTSARLPATIHRSTMSEDGRARRVDGS